MIKCYEVQFAIRLKKLRGDQKRFLIVRDAWNMGKGEALEIARAGMILHEINGEDAILRENDAYRDNTRFFTFEISTQEFSSFTAEDYLNLLKDSGKISRISTLLTEGKHYFSEGLAIRENHAHRGTEISGSHAKLINLDFEKTEISYTLIHNQYVKFEHISLILPTGTTISGVFNNRIDSYRDTITLSSPIACIMFHTQERSLAVISSVSIYSDEKVEIRGSNAMPLSKIQVQGQEVYPYRFHKSGRVSEIELLPNRDNGRSYEFTTVKGEKIKFDSFQTKKLLTFNEEEILEYYTPISSTIDIPYTPRIDSPSDVSWRDPDNTDYGARFEIGTIGIDGENANHHQTESMGTLRLDLLPIDRQGGNFLLGRFYQEGRGDSARVQYEALSITQFLSLTEDQKLQLGYHAALAHGEEDRLRGFDLLDMTNAGASLRWHPFENNNLRIDVGASTAIKSRAYISDKDLSRVSPEWKNHAEQVNGAPIEPAKIQNWLLNGRDTESYTLKLNACYRSPQRVWECNVGGFYRFDELSPGNHDHFSPYASLLDKTVKRWNAYADMKYYFDKANSEPDANNYFFLRAEIDDSPLGSNLQTLFDPDQSSDQVEKRTSLTTGFGWEW